jgi:hypothetical protein
MKLYTQTHILSSFMNVTAEQGGNGSSEIGGHSRSARGNDCTYYKVNYYCG